MQIVEFGTKIESPIVLCLGYFGCMHKGHLELLRLAKLRAEEHDAAVALFTFSNNHLKVLGKNFGELYTFDERLSIYKSLGIDYVISATFDDGMRRMSGSDFLSRLNANCDLCGIVCGFDHVCGSDFWNHNRIREFFDKICRVDVADEVSLHGRKISTTLIRNLIIDHKICEANGLLSQPYFIEGVVTVGRGVGRSIGFPTANLIVDGDKIVPLGVFGGYCKIESVEYPCIVNIGNAPTFGVNTTMAEVHLLNFHGDLYGKKIKVSVTKYLRETLKFDSANDLAKQLQIDKENILND